MEDPTLEDISYTTVGTAPIDEDEEEINYSMDSTEENLDSFINDLNEKDKVGDMPDAVEEAIKNELNVPSAETIDRLKTETNGVETNGHGVNVLTVQPNGEHVFKIPSRPVGRPKDDSPKKKNLEEPSECPICGKQFKHVKDMKRHEQRHSGVKLFGCEVCSKRFTRNEYLKTHMKRHMGILDYPCNLCDKAFTQQKDLNSHLSTHNESQTATITYYCQFCSHKFMILGMLKEHLKKAHGGQSHPWICNVCEKSYKLVKELKLHMKEDHDEK